jgi:hypothetical protein
VRRPAAFFLVYALLAAACGSNSNPASPSESANPGGASGATISGAIVSAGSGASTMGVQAAAPQAMSGLTVTVAGTNVSANVDNSDRFVLRGIPAGNVQLQFSAPGFAAGLGIADVRTAEAITLTVSLAGASSVVLESQRRSMGSEEQLEGRVETLPPAVAAGSLVVAGRTVLTSSTTAFFLRGANSTFAALAVGQRVHVKGETAGSSLRASVVEIQNTNEDIPVEINGTVESLTGGSSGFEFRVDGRLVRGDATTEFFGGSRFADLANGRRVEVKGQQRNGFVFATRIHVNDVPGTTPPPETSASIEGPLTSKTGAVPGLTLVVGGTTVRTTASTDVQRKGDKQDLNVLALGMTLHVVGDRQSDGSLVARMIQIKDDAAGGEFEISGSAGGVKGSCPSLTFGVNGYDIFTDGATVFSLPCADLKSGTKVKVKGLVQPGGAVRATSVAKQ